MPVSARRGVAGAALTLAAAMLPVTSAAAALPPPVPIAWQRLAGSVPSQGLRGARELGPAPLTQRLHLDVTLSPPDPAGLRSYLAALSDRTSPLFHHFLSRGQFGQLFGPSLAEVAAVSAALRSVGLAPGAATVDRLSIPVDTTVGGADNALRTRIADYRLATGRVAYAPGGAPELPASVAPFVQGILGLSDLARAEPAGLVRALTHSTGRAARPRVESRAAGPQACSAASTTAGALGAYTPGELADAYRMTPLYAMGDFGYGVTVALVELAPNLPSDIAAYQACYGTSAAVSYVAVDGGAGAMSDGSVEATGDIQDVIGLAPKAAIDVYQAPNTPSSLYDDYASIVNADS
ncbi:MAG: protease pro-enzyme activation domain-containing protein, partial [Mycobacteriales bacterium]